jgi:uncharacterized membrane protein (DUF441 family)
MNARDYVLGVWKTFVVTATGLIVAWLTNRGIHLSDAQTAWITIVALSAGLAGYNLLVNFLLARKGDSPTAKAARLLGKLLTLGGKPPVYPTVPPTTPVVMER